MVDLNQAILVVREDIDATSLDHPDRHILLGNLGGYLNNRYLATREVKDLDEAIRMTREAVDAAPLDHPNRAKWLYNLHTCLSNRYSLIGELTDLEDAIQIARQAIDAFQLEPIAQARQLNTLGWYLGNDRYYVTGAIGDIEEAIQMARRAADVTPPDHPARAGWLINLGIYLGRRYSRTGSMGSLEEAIRVTQEAVNATPIDHPARAGWLGNLGNRLSDRYIRTGALVDLNEAIRVAWEAVDAIPLGHPDRPTLLDNLGARLGDRYPRTGEVADLENACRIGQEALNATPLNHSNRPTRLDNLGSNLGMLYSHSGTIATLDKAISVMQEAVDATPPDHPYFGMYLGNLGIHLGDKYSFTKTMESLGETIDVAQKAVDVLPLDHSERARYLNNLGSHLRQRYSLTGVLADRKKAQESFVEALHLSGSAIRLRIDAGREFLSLPGILSDPGALNTVKYLMELLPLLTPRSLQNLDKQFLLSAIAGLASEAAAMALHTNQSLLTALEWLETGRGVIAGAFFDQSDISNLQINYPELAETFMGLREQLDEPVSQAPEAEDNQGRETEKQLFDLLHKIRSIAGFERFLLPASETDMLSAAKHGPIVVLNVSTHRCDAFIIEESDIRLLKLPHISRDTINEYVEDLESLETLTWLWDDIVCPILEALGYTVPASSDCHLPRIWWIPTGKLTRFPFHAAGRHLDCNSTTALDRVISSYSSSVKAIIYRHRQLHQELINGDRLEIVAVAMDKTEGQEPLEYASHEVEAVLAVLQPAILPKSPLPRYKNDVLSALKTCKLFHFAGHGSTNSTQPLQSTLFLKDWKQEPLTIASLLEANLNSTRPFLAYLSACGTGQILDEKSFDESIHIANACQLIGFRHVVGTLWSVNDKLCVDVARMTYQFLCNNGMKDRAVSEGLHYAIRKLRDDWINEINEDESLSGSRVERHAELYDPSRASRPYWVPYVHFGV
ncbi:CHAT domain-containing protein [Trichoderma simmonsii]|uniref:CHAT domain-containing protein n=1 Tax=Trichoderma simmonsii TaxID=1491479 RepID=A0A8G0LGR6_9HYPO|nr:CHAT domain-containing protein [Trichoderma simmonsii]